jgi:hypothetical protein
MIVAGRMLPPPWSIMAMTRAFFCDDPEPVPLPESFVDDQGRLVYPTDPRFRAMQWQLCEEETNQTIGRLRLIWRDDFPLVLVGADIAITRHGPWTATMSWKAIVPSRLQLAMVEAGGVLPLSAKLLNHRWPELWLTAEAAKHEIREAKKGADRPYRELTSHLLFSYRRSAPFPAGSPRLATCRLLDQRGHPTTVLVAPWAVDPRATLEAFFGIKVVFWRDGEEAAITGLPGGHLADPEQDEAEIYADPEPATVVAHPKREEILSPPFELASAAPPIEPPRPVRHRTAGNLALAADWVETADRVSLAAISISTPASPVNDPAPWQDHLWWSSGFLTCRTSGEHLSRLRQWVEAAGGTIVVMDGMARAELPKLPPGMGRAELFRFCRQLRVSVREAV